MSKFWTGVVVGFVWVALAVPTYLTMENANRCLPPEKRDGTAYLLVASLMWPSLVPIIGAAAVFTGSAGVLACGSEWAIPFGDKR